LLFFLENNSVKRPNGEEGRCCWGASTCSVVIAIICIVSEKKRCTYLL
jgi:hypothetical protein